MTMVLVAEIHACSDASPEDLRLLGEALAACQQAHVWIAAFGGIDELLAGRQPARLPATIAFHPGLPPPAPTDHAVLVWAWTPCPVEGPIDVKAVLGAAIRGLGRVDSPTPD